MKLFVKNGQKIFDEIFKDMPLSQFFSLNDIPKGVSIEGIKKLSDLLLPIKKLNLSEDITVFEALIITEILSNKDKYENEYPEFFDNTEQINKENIPEEMEEYTAFDKIILEELFKNDTEDESDIEDEEEDTEDNSDFQTNTNNTTTLEQELQDIAKFKKTLQEDIQTQNIFNQKLKN